MYNRGMVIEPGTLVVDGAYRILEEVGRGGVGAVYRAHQTTLARDVALKVLVRADDDETRAWMDAGTRLADEARAAARIQHAGLVRIFSAGLDDDLGPYIVYEYMPGGTLRQRLQPGHAMGLVEAMRLFGSALLGGLGALHDAAVVHRDVKPENLLGDADGTFKLGDLGLAVFDDRETRTKTGLLVGTPGYVAPEVLVGTAREPTPAFDVYSAAVVLVEAATGAHPFPGETAAKQLAEQLKRPLTAARLQTLGLPAAAAAVLARALSNDPAERPPTAAALLADIEAGTSGVVPRATTSMADDGATPRSTAPHPTTEAVRAPTRPSPTRQADPAHERSFRSPRPARRGPSWPRTLVVALLCAVACALLALRWRGPVTDVPVDDDTTATAVIDEDGVRALRERLMTSKRTPDANEASLLATFVRRTGIRDRLGLAAVTADEPLALVYLARFAVQAGDTASAWRYYRRLVTRHGPAAVPLTSGSILEETADSALLALAAGDLAAQAQTFLRGRDEPRSWALPALTLLEGSARRGLALRSKPVDRDTNVAVEYDLKSTIQLTLALGWRSFPPERRYAMFMALLSACSALGAADVTDGVTEYFERLARDGGFAVVDGVDGHQAVELWRRVVTIQAVSTDINPVRRTRALGLLDHGLAQARRASVTADERASLLCLRALIHLRANVGTIVTSARGVDLSLAEVDRMDLTGLSPAMAARVKLLRASALNSGNRTDEAEVLLKSIDPDELHDDDRWLYHLDWYEVHAYRNQYAAADAAITRGAAAAPPDLYGYVRGRLEACRLDRNLLGPGIR